MHPAIPFRIKDSPRIEHVNGKINVAFTSTDDVLFQIVGLAPPLDFDQATRYSADEFRLVLMNSEVLDGALTSSSDEGGDSEVVLRHLESGAWRMNGRGEVSGGDKKYRVTFSTVFDEFPEPRLIRN